MQCQDIGVTDEGHGMTLALIQTFAIRGDLFEENPSNFKVGLDKFIEEQHVTFLGKLHMIGDILQDFGHQHETSFDVGWRLFFNNAHFVWRADGRVDEPEEHDGTNGSNVVLGAITKDQLLCGKIHKKSSKFTK